jgi:hypothetical protein
MRFYASQIVRSQRAAGDVGQDILHVRIQAITH